MSDKWFYLENGSRKGPASRPQLIEMLLDGQLPLSTNVWRPGMGGVAASAATAGPFIAEVDSPFPDRPARTSRLLKKAGFQSTSVADSAFSG